MFGASPVNDGNINEENKSKSDFFFENQFSQNEEFKNLDGEVILRINFYGFFLFK